MNENTFDYRTALEWLHLGRGVRRLRWMQPSTIRVVSGAFGVGPYVDYPINPVTERPNAGSRLPYIFSEEDVAATDWFVVQ